MQTPTYLDLQLWLKHEYDPVKAREYYLRTRKLKGRKKKRQQVSNLHRRLPAKTLPTQSKLTAAQKAFMKRQKAVQKAAEQAKLEQQQAAEKARIEKQKAVRSKLRKDLSAKIQDLEGKLKKLENLIAAKERKEKSQSRKAQSRERLAAREAAKPPTAAEKSQAARESAQYRDRNQQKIQAAGNRITSVGGNRITSAAAVSAPTSKKVQDVEHLKALATKVKGEINVAKQKLAAL
jgi:hypothetical protein